MLVLLFSIWFSFFLCWLIFNCSTVQLSCDDCIFVVQIEIAWGIGYEVILTSYRKTLFESNSFGILLRHSQDVASKTYRWIWEKTRLPLVNHNGCVMCIYRDNRSSLFDSTSAQMTYSILGMHLIHIFCAPCSNLMALYSTMSLNKFRFNENLYAFFCRNISSCAMCVWYISTAHTRGRETSIFFYDEHFFSLNWYNFCQYMQDNLPVRINSCAFRTSFFRFWLRQGK